MFQFLIGTIKTKLKRMQLPKIFLVSIPHRYDKNKVSDGSSGRLRRVSIPHRYDKNCHINKCMPEHMRWFQFLIGTIKTVLGSFVCAPTPPFQFLIGTIKTFSFACFILTYSRLFQFLIGTIKTCRRFHVVAV